MVLHIYLSLRTAECIQVFFTLFRHVNVPSGQPKTVFVPPNTGLLQRPFVSIVDRHAASGARGRRFEPL